MTKSDITNLLNAARKAKNPLEIAVYGDILSRIGNQEIALKKLELSPDEVTGIIKKAAAEREESMVTYQKAGRKELMNKELDEWSILKKHLPATFSEEETEEAINAAIIETGSTNKKQIGAIMSLLKKMHGGKLDMKLVSVSLGKKLS